mgnify:CR=1 FL=1
MADQVQNDSKQVAKLETSMPAKVGGDAPSNLKSQWQERACITAIGDARHNKFRETIGDSIHRKHDTKLSFVKSKVGKHWDCH